MAGTSATQPQSSIVYKNASYSLAQNLTTDWYVVTAAADLDSDSTTATLVVGASWTNQLTIVNEGQ